MVYVLAAAPAYAEILSSQDRMTGLTTAMRLTDFAGNTDSQDLAKLDTTVAEFTAQAENAQALASREGAELKQLHAKLNNYMRIRKVLTECPLKPDKLNHLGDRIMAAAGAVQAENMESCDGHHDLGDAVQTSGKIAENALMTQKSKLESLVYAQSMANSSAALARMKNVMGEGIVGRDVNADIEGLCTDKGAPSTCTPELKRKMVAANQLALTSFRQGRTDRISFKDAADSLNKVIGELNNGASLDAAASLDPAVASLLFTSVLTDKVGNIFAPATKDRKFTTVEGADMRIAADQARTAILNDVHRLSQSHRNSQRPADMDGMLRDLVRRDPVAVGQVLINHPELATMVCSVLQDLEKSRASKEKWDSAWKVGMMAGMAAVGVGLMLTGAGAPLGVAMLMGAGTALSLADATHSGIAAYNAYKDSEALQASYLAGRGDMVTAAEAKDKKSEYDRDLRQMVIQLALSAGQTAFMLNSLAKAGRLGAASEVFNELGRDSGLLQSMQALRASIGESETAKLLVRLANLGKEGRARAFNLIRENMPASVVKAGTVSKEALKAGSDKIAEGVETLERSHIMGKAVAKGLKFGYQLHKDAAKEWRYVTMVAGTHTGVETVFNKMEGKETFLDWNPIVMAHKIKDDKDLLQNVGFMTGETAIQAGISFTERAWYSKLALMGVFALGASAATSLLVKSNADPARVVGDAAWEMLPGSAGTLIDEKAIRYFREQEALRKGMRIRGYAVAFGIQTTELSAYSLAAHTYEGTVATRQMAKKGEPPKPQSASSAIDPSKVDPDKITSVHLIPILEPL
jgi:hypothetical protein